MPRQLPNDRWQARIVDPRTGKRVSLGTFATMKEAKKVEVYKLAALEAGEIASGGRVKFEKFALDFLESRKHDLSASTFRNYLADLNKWIIPSFGHRELRQITPAAVRAWYINLPEGPSRKARYHLFGSIIRQAVDDGEIPRDVSKIKGAGKDTATKREAAPLADVQMLRTLAGETSQMGVLLHLLVGTAVRIGEGLALDWQDIDLDAGTVHVHRHLSKVEGLVEGTKHKRDGHRTLALPESVTQALSAFKKTRKPEHDHPVFLNAAGRRMSYRTFITEFNALRAALGLDHNTAHMLRHASLSMYADGASMVEIMERGGHSDYRSALRYQHPTLERDKENAKKLDAKLSGTA